MKTLLLFSAILASHLVRPNGYYHQEYNYRTSSSSYKNHELQHQNDDVGYYSKDGDLEGRIRPRVNAHSQHSEYVNPQLQHGYHIGTDRTSSFGQLHAQNQFRPEMGGAGYGMMGPPPQDYGVNSNLGEVTAKLQREMEGELQRAVYEHYQRAAAYGGSVTQAQMEADRRVLEEELRRNMTMRMQEALKQHYGNQGIRGGHSYSIIDGRLQPVANYNNRELADLTRQMEMHLLRHLDQQVQTYYHTRVDTEVHTRRNTYRTVNGVADNYPSNMQQRPVIYQPYPPQPHPQPYPQPHPVPPIPDSITTVATRVQTELNEILNKILEDTQRRYFAENIHNSGINYDAVLAQLQDELRTNITFHFDEQIKRAYGHTNYASKYSMEDIENLRRQIETNLITKLNRDFNRQRERYFQMHNIYVTPRPIPANHVYYPMNYHADIATIQRQLQEEMSRQLQTALVQQSYRQPHDFNAQAHYQATLQQLSAELNRNLTRQMELMNVHQYQGAYAAQLANMRNQLQHDLMRQLEHGLQQSFSRWSSWSSSSSHHNANYRPVRGFDPHLYNVMGEDCMMGDQPAADRKKRSPPTDAQQVQTYDDLGQYQEPSPIMPQTYQTDLTQQTLVEQPPEQRYRQRPYSAPVAPPPTSQMYEPLYVPPPPPSQTVQEPYQVSDLYSPPPQSQVQTFDPPPSQVAYQRPVPVRYVQKTYESPRQYTSTYDWYLQKQEAERNRVRQRVQYYESLQRQSNGPHYQRWTPNQQSTTRKPPYHYVPQQTQDLTEHLSQQTDDSELNQLTQQNQDQFGQQAQVYTDQQSRNLIRPDRYGQQHYLTRQNDDLTQQSQDMTQQTQDLTQQSRYLPQQSQDLTQQTQDLTQENQYLTQQSRYLPQQSQDLTQQTQDLTQQNQYLTQQSRYFPQQSQDLTQQTQDLTQQTQDLTQQSRYLPQQSQDLTQQTQDLTQQTEDLTQQSRYTPQQNQYLTQQTEDLTQQTEDLTQQSEDRTQQSQDLTQQTEDLTQQTEDLTQQSRYIPQQSEDLTQQNQDQDQDLTQQSEDLTQQNQDQDQDLTQQSEDLTQQNQDLTQQTEDLTQQTQDLTQQPRNSYLNQQTQDFLLGEINQYQHFADEPTTIKSYTQESEDLTQQSQDLTQQNEDLTQQTEDLTQQSEDLTQQSQDSTLQSENLTQQTDDLTQQTQDLTQQTEDIDRTTTSPNQQRLQEAQSESQRLLDVLRNQSRENQQKNYTPRPVYSNYYGQPVQVGETRRLPSQDEVQKAEEPQVNYAQVEDTQTETVDDIEPIEAQVADEVQTVDDPVTPDEPEGTTQKPGFWARFKQSVKNRLG